MRDLLQRCLDKDAKQRLRDIGDARLVLDREKSGAVSTAVAAAVHSSARSPRRNFLPIGAAIAIVTAIATALAVSRGGGPRLPRDATHLSIAFPEDPKILDGQWSRDGSTVVLVGVPLAEETKGAASFRLYVRRLDDFELHELPGSLGAGAARITPDGRSVVFRAPLAPGSTDMRLARMPLDGSAPPVTIAPWNPDWNSFVLLRSGEIVALDRYGSRLFRISPRDGRVKEVKLAAADAQGTMTLQRPLPDDRGVFVNAGVYREKGWAMETGIVDLEKARVVLPGIVGGNAMLLPDGTLLYSLGQVLLAAPFDAAKLALRSAPVAVATGLASDFSYTPGEYTVSDGGTLCFVPGGEAGNGRRLGAVDAAGKLTLLPSEPRPYQGWPSSSRDGRTFAVRVTNAQGIDEIWIGDRASGNLRRLVSWPKADCTSLYLSPDGRTVAYARVGRDAEDGIYLADVDGTGPGHRVLAADSARIDRCDGWSPDGRWLVVSRRVGGGKGDLWIAGVTPTRDSIATLRPLRATDAEEEGTEFSPDGRRIAFQGDETGRKEVYVAPFSPEGTLGRAVRITDQGGTVPEWMPDGRHLAFRDLFNKHEKILDVDVPGAVHAAREWFDFEALKINDGALSHDGGALVILKGPAETNARAVNFVFGWTDELKRKLAKAR